MPRVLYKVGIISYFFVSHIMEIIGKIKSFLLENQSIRQTVAKNTFWLSLSQFVGRLLRAAVVIYAARMLGAESWGAFSYALGLAAFLTIFADIGIAGLITREASRHPELRQKYLATALGIKIAMLGAGIGIFLYIAPRITSVTEVLVIFPVIALLTAFDSLRDLTTSLARAIEKLELEAAVNIFTNLAIMILGFAFLSVNSTSKSLATAYVIGSGMGLLAMIFTLREYFRGLIKNFTYSLIKPILTSAWPFGLMGLMGAFMINTDLIMIGLMRSIGEVGYYSAAQRPIQLLYILPGLLAVPLFPVMSRLVGEPERFKPIFNKVLRFTIVGALPVALGGILLGKEIMLLLYGSEYLAGAPVFQILSITMLVTFPSLIVGNAIFANNKERDLIYYAIIGAGGNLLLDLVLIPKYGMVGSSWATVITQIISNAYAWYRMRSFIGSGLLQGWWRPILAALAMILFVLAVKTVSVPVLVTIIAAAAVYLAMLILLKESSLKSIVSVFR